MSKVTENIKKSGSLPTLKTMGYIAGGSILLIAGIFIFSGGDETNVDTGESFIESAEVEGGYVPGAETQQNAYYKKLIKEADKKKLDEAKKTGSTSFIETPDFTTSEKTEDNKKLLEEVEKLKIQMEKFKSENESLKQQLEDASIANSASTNSESPAVDFYQDGKSVYVSNEVKTRRDQVLQAMMTEITSADVAPAGGEAITGGNIGSSGAYNQDLNGIYVANENQGPQGGMTYGTGENPGSGATSNLGAGQSAVTNGKTSKGSKPIINAGDMLYATLDMTANSDAPGPVMATIHQGPLEGAKVIGRFEKKQDYLVLSFNRLSLPNGKTYDINAVAVDPMVLTVAMADDVDRHIGSKLAAIFGAAWLQGIGEAYLQSGTVEAVGSTQSVIKKSALDTAGDVAIAGLAKVGQSLAKMLEPYANRPDTVVKYANTDLMVLFVNPVEESK